jgi:hypothetical protein
VVVPPAYQNLNPRFDICVSHKGGIFIQWEVTFPSPMVTSSTSRSPPAQSFRGTHRGRVCVLIILSVCERLRFFLLVIFIILEIAFTLLKIMNRSLDSSERK